MTDVTEFDQEPAIATQVSLLTLSGADWTRHPAKVVDLTRQELWVSIDRHLGEPLDPGKQVRLVVKHPNESTQTADTIVLWHIGRNGNVVVLKRPRLWEPPSRRDHARVALSIPIYIKSEDGESIPAMSTNLGLGGAFCISPMPLRIAQRVDITIQLTPTQYFDCEAEVARMDRDSEDPAGDGHVVGLHFLDVVPERQAYLGEALAMLAADVDEHFVPRPWRPGEQEPEEMEMIG